MTLLDWTLVILLNGGIVLYAVMSSRSSDTTEDWFLGGRSVPWWIVGISAFATAIDGSDLVADTGGVYTLGVRYFVTNWVGTVGGWLVLAYFVAVPMYRLGMYTNSEYLEARFGPTARVLSSLVQVQYRTMVLANISTTLFLTLTVVGGMGWEAWLGVFAVVLMSLSYSFFGGSRSVAVTDAFQSVVMVAASLVLFGLAWHAVGGWNGIRSRLQTADPGLAGQMLKVGADHRETVELDNPTEEILQRQLLLGGEYDAASQTWSRTTPSWIVCLSFILVGMAYSIVNHEQSMRFFAARSLWDMKMAVSVAGLLLIGITFFNLMMGVVGRALFPSLAELPVDPALRGTPDAIYPVLVRDFTISGLRGLVVAGLIAAAVSTYAGIATAMSALVTRDLYARLIYRGGSDRHYLHAGRWFTAVILGVSFLYIPFLLKRGMMMFYLDLVGAFVVPLLTIYLMGIFTPVHRASGTIGLIAGVLYGAARLLAGPIASQTGLAILPSDLMNGFVAYPVSFCVTAFSMILVSLVLGWERGPLTVLPEASNRSEQETASLEAGLVSQRDDRIPLVLGGVVLGLGCFLSFVLFW